MSLFGEFFKTQMEINTAKNVREVAKSNKEIKELLKEQKMTEAEIDKWKGIK